MDQKLQRVGLNTALVFVGWIAFFLGFLPWDLFTNVALQTVARVLPSTGDGRSASSVPCLPIPSPILGSKAGLLG